MRFNGSCIDDIRGPLRLDADRKLEHRHRRGHALPHPTQAQLSPIWLHPGNAANAGGGHLAFETALRQEAIILDHYAVKVGPPGLVQSERRPSQAKSAAPCRIE